MDLNTDGWVWFETETGPVAQVRRNVLEAIAANGEVSMPLRERVDKLLAKARYEIIWVYHEEETADELTRLLP